jgi:predicted phosphodiesterase
VPACTDEVVLVARHLGGVIHLESATVALRWPLSGSTFFAVCPLCREEGPAVFDVTPHGARHLLMEIDTTRIPDFVAAITQSMSVTPPSSWWCPGVFREMSRGQNLLNVDAVLAEVRNRITIEPALHRTVTDPANTPKPDGFVRLVCVSDTHTVHGVLDPLPAGDVLVHAGDFTDVGKAADIRDFCAWLVKQKERFREVVVIAGNHDLSLDKDSYWANYRRFGHRQKENSDELVALMRQSCTYLDHEVAEVCGLRFFGSPYQPEFCDWAFNLGRITQCRAKWESMIPAFRERPFDVLLTHGPPLGHGDMCQDGGRAGCTDLLDFVHAFPPLVHVFGHIHEGYGATTNGETLFVNASTLDERYNQRRPHPPIVIDVPLPRSDGRHADWWMESLRAAPQKLEADADE